MKEALNSVPPATKKTREKIALYEKKKNPISPNRIINNSIGNELKSDVARLINHHTFKYALHTNQVAASCVNTDFWLDKIARVSRHTLELGR